MIEHVGGSPEANQNPWTQLFQSILLLRVGCGLLLMYRHGWQAVRSAYEFLWNEQPWAWVTLVKDAGLPLPHLLTPVLAVAVAAVALSWITGFLTRLFAFLFLPLAGAFVFFAGRAGSDAAETGWLYLLASLTLLLFGSGAVSLDQLFRIGESWSAETRKKGW